MLGLNCDRASSMFSIKIAPKCEEKDDCAVLQTLNQCICCKYHIVEALMQKLSLHRYLLSVHEVCNTITN